MQQLESGLSLSLASPASEPCQLTLDQWAEYAGSHPAATIFHHRRWLELLRDQYGFTLQIWGVYEAGQIAAALPLIKSRVLGRGCRVSGLPFSDVVPFLYRRREDAEGLLRQLADTLPGDVRSMVLRCDEPLQPATNVAAYVRHLIDLEPPLEQIEARYPRTLHQNLRQAARDGLQFDAGTDRSFVDDFYRLHLQTRSRHGAPVQPRSFFARLQKHLLEAGLGFVGRIRLGEKAIAAAIFLHHQDKFVCKYSASDQAFLSHRPNDLLMHHGIRIARSQGCTSFDFGVSGCGQEGLRRFKSKWGAVESTVYDCYLRGEPGSAGVDSPLFRFASRILRFAPAWCCRAAGELGYRYLA